MLEVVWEEWFKMVFENLYLILSFQALLCQIVMDTTYLSLLK